MHTNGGRCEWIVVGKEECAPVLAIVVRGFWRPGEDVVPF